MAISVAMQVNHALYEEVDQILGTLHHAHLLWWRVDEVDPQQLMLMSQLWSVRVRPE